MMGKNEKVCPLKTVFVGLKTELKKYEIEYPQKYKIK